MYTAVIFVKIIIPEHVGRFHATDRVNFTRIGTPVLEIQNNPQV